MNQLSCEKCGSTDLIKQDGMYICQYCGAKYMADESKKLGDNSEKLQKLYKIARQSRDNNDSENAAKYYGMIMEEDPDSWEALFYNVYYRALQTKIFYIESAANSIANCLGNVLYLIKNGITDTKEQEAAVTEVVARVMLIGDILEQNARSAFKSAACAYAGDLAEKFEKSFSEYQPRTKAIYNIFFMLGDLIEKDFSGKSDYTALAAKCWEIGIKYWAGSNEFLDDRVHNKIKMDDSYGVKIRKYKPSYSIPSGDTTGYPYDPIKLRNSPYGSSSSGGCYVATAVYGSYDCPQVWTLRRYRDDTLAKTWYGRAFIHTYYAISPTLVRWFGRTKWFKKLWKGKLDRMIAKLQAKGVESTPYDDKCW